jgi:hypothetical protein
MHAFLHSKELLIILFALNSRMGVREITSTDGLVGYDTALTRLGSRVRLPLGVMVLTFFVFCKLFEIVSFKSHKDDLDIQTVLS